MFTQGLVCADSTEREAAPFNTFSLHGGYNETGGKNNSVFSGSALVSAPWCEAIVVHDEEREHYLRLRYDVSRGRIAYEQRVNDSEQFSRYRGLSFWVRGEEGTITCHIQAKMKHSYVVPVTNEWKKVYIPFKKISYAQSFSPHDVRSVSFIIEKNGLKDDVGAINIDDVMFEVAVPRTRNKVLPEPSVIYRINSKRVNRSYPSQSLVLETRVRAIKKIQELIEEVRFEISPQGKEQWMYVAHADHADNGSYAGLWDAQYFPTGDYQCRAVIVYDDNVYMYGNPITLSISNSGDASFSLFLDKLQRSQFRYITREKDAQRGLINAASDQKDITDITACAMALCAYAVGIERGFITRKVGAEHVLALLDGVRSLRGAHGFFPAIAPMNADVDISAFAGDTVVTSWVVAAAWFMEDYFDRLSENERAIRTYARDIISGVVWRKALIKNDAGDMVLARNVIGAEKVAHPLAGFDEGMLAHVVAFAAERHAIGADAWEAWKQTFTNNQFAWYSVIDDGVLPHKQDPHIFLSVKHAIEGQNNYYKDAAVSTLINREFGLRTMKASRGVWGIYPTTGPEGKKQYAVTARPEDFDGTICPPALCASLPFAAEASIAGINALRDAYPEKSVGPYGLRESINHENDFFNVNYNARNLLRAFLHIENYRTGFVQRRFSQIPSVRIALSRLGFKSDR